MSDDDVYRPDDNDSAAQDAEPAYDNDPVARFFSAHRSTVRPEPASELDWARIRRRAGRRGPGRFLIGAVAAAAVAAVAGFGVWTVQTPQHNGPIQAASQRTTRSGAPSAAASGTQSDRGPVAGPAQRDQLSAPQPRVVVPDSFVTWSLSNAGNSTVYDLGSSSCGGFVCPTLLKSTDNGAHWTGVHTFAGTRYSTPVGPGASRIHADDQLRDVRFVTPKVGYVFGGDLLVTRDGGATFSRVAHPGRTVLDVEAYQGDLLVLTGQQCGADMCAGSVSVTRMDTSANTVPTTGASTADLTVPISSAQIAVRDGVAYLSLVSATGGAALPSLRLVGGSLQPIAAPDACNSSSLQAITPAADLHHVLFALCAPVVDGSRTSYTLVRSPDDGTTWTVVSTGAVQLPTGARPDLAALDDDHLAAAAGASGTTGSSSIVGAGSLVVSADGGANFTAKDGPLGLPATGVDWLASPGGRQYYAITLSGSGYWWSTDSGRTWRLVNPIG